LAESIFKNIRKNSYQCVGTFIVNLMSTQPSTYNEYWPETETCSQNYVFFNIQLCIDVVL